jgi:hypothetical protein
MTKKPMKFPDSIIKAMQWSANSPKANGSKANKLFPKVTQNFCPKKNYFIGKNRKIIYCADTENLLSKIGKSDNNGKIFFATTFLSHYFIWGAAVSPLPPYPYSGGIRGNPRIPAKPHRGFIG